jgi:hypothetical protein
MSISSVTQTITAPPITQVSTPGSTQQAAATTSTATGTAALSALSGNPIGSLSSDLQSYLLQQQSQGDGTSQVTQGHHHHGHHAGTNVDAPTLPGGNNSAATA